MKKLIVALFSLVLAATAAHAQLLFSDDLNYANGCIETDGLWFAYSPAAPAQNAFVTNDLLILAPGTSEDSVAAPFTNNSGNTLVFGSFTINVSQLPSVNGGYFAVFMQDSNNVDVADVGHVFIDTKNTTVPGTYRLGVADFATSITTAGATNFPVDLATGITYQVVFSYDPNNSDPLAGATIWVNPSSENDFNVFANDSGGSAEQTAIGTNISAIGFSPYTSAAISDVMVGLNFTDVMTNVVQLPVIGIQPQGTSLYAGNPTTLYTAASGMDVSYQWLSNSVPLTDNGVTIIGSVSNVLVLSNLQATASYSVVATTTAGSVTSAVAVVSVNTTPTQPFFTLQPVGETNSLDSPVSLTAAANGSGIMSYQWYFEASGGSSFSPLSGQTGQTLSFTAAYANSGLYYVTATGSDGSANSATVSVLVIPPTLVSLAYMHANCISNLDINASINGGEVFNVEGVVTSIGQIESKTTAEFFIQDGTGGCLVYAGGFNPTNAPPVGALVNVISPAESYYGELEMDPTTTSPTNAVIVLSTNNPLPATIPLNLPLIATNTMGTYGQAIQCSLVTMTNVYLYSSASGAAVSGTFPANGTKALYAFQQPYSAGEPYVEVYVYTYTNSANLLNTNYFNQPIPSFCYELTGAMGIYSPTQPELYPSRFADFVTTKPASFKTTVAVTNGLPTLTWPTTVGQTYSVYSATNLLGPWTQTFGLGYYPSVGSFKDTNANGAAFYQISTP